MLIFRGVFHQPGKHGKVPFFRHSLAGFRVYPFQGFRQLMEKNPAPLWDASKGLNTGFSNQHLGHPKWCID